MRVHLSTASQLQEIRRMAEEVTSREGCRLYDVEFVGGQSGRVLRVTIDKADGQNVSIEDCSNVSKGLNLLLDVEDIIDGAYHLEVSSPGLERVLKNEEHFAGAVGQVISVKTYQPLLQFNPGIPELGKAKQIQGRLLAYDDRGLKVDSNGREVLIPKDTVTKAHVVFEFVNPAENKPGQKRSGGSKNGQAKF